MNEVLDWARLEQQLKQPSKPSPCSEVSAEERERDRLEISKIAEELRRREPHWSPIEVWRYLVEVLEQVLEEEKK
jgi:hypothetical protein